MAARHWPVAQAPAPIHSPADAAQGNWVSGLSPGQDYDSAKRVMPKIGNRFSEKDHAQIQKVEA
ncbi:MAG TPA: hypothetical protein VGF02_01945 [Pseudolabrys sp.]